jgi:antitoxin component YwqK of YwqJK toxin-antitoxin module
MNYPYQLSKEKKYLPIPLKSLFFFLLLPFFACCTKSEEPSETNGLMSMQFVDRNGISETISSHEKLDHYKNIDFLDPQPFSKVYRVFGRSEQGKSPCVVTTYHPNGYIWQYLEVLDGRAHGFYKEWFQNGNLKMELQVIEGLADLTEAAQSSWIFDGTCLIWDEMKRKVAEIHYDKGSLQGDSIYYFPDGTIQKILPYRDDEINGEAKIFNESGELIELQSFVHGLQHGTSYGLWKPQLYKYEEKYTYGLLDSATYRSYDEKIISEISYGSGKRAEFQGTALLSLSEYQGGHLQGKVELFHPSGYVKTSYIIHDGKKCGEEWEYYPPTNEHLIRPKLLVVWQDDEIQQVKTWYENGNLESQKEFHSNKKNGMQFAWYEEGALMFIEEYDNDNLTRGSYYKLGDPQPISKVESGGGTATLYTKKGHFLKKILYDRGKPVVESIN